MRLNHAAMTLLVPATISCALPISQERKQRIHNSKVIWSKPPGLMTRYKDDLRLPINQDGMVRGWITIESWDIYLQFDGRAKERIWKHQDYGGLDKILQSADGNSVYVCAAHELIGASHRLITINLVSSTWNSRLIPHDDYYEMLKD